MQWSLSCFSASLTHTTRKCNNNIQLCSCNAFLQHNPSQEMVVRKRRRPKGKKGISKSVFLLCAHNFWIKFWVFMFLVWYNFECRAKERELKKRFKGMSCYNNFTFSSDSFFYVIFTLLYSISLNDPSTQLNHVNDDEMTLREAIQSVPFQKWDLNMGWWCGKTECSKTHVKMQRCCTEGVFYLW